MLYRCCRVLTKCPSGIKALRGEQIFRHETPGEHFFENRHDVFDFFLDKFDARKSIGEHRDGTEWCDGLSGAHIFAFPPCRLCPDDLAQMQTTLTHMYIHEGTVATACRRPINKI